jgi:hypothetical protein
MTPAVHGYYYGYQGKQAASDDDLPRKTWWNLLPGHALEEAGRGKAIFEAQGKEPPKTVKHPWWNMIKGTALGGVAGGVAGGAVGGLAGAGVGSQLQHIDPREGAALGTFAGSTLGTFAGGLTGLILALRSSLKRTQAEAKSLEERGITPEVSGKARQLLEEKAKKNMLLHSLGGLFVGHVMHGRASQLQKLTGDPDTARFEKWPRILAGSQLPSSALTGGVAGPLINTGQGLLSVIQARRALGLDIKTPFALK